VRVDSHLYVGYSIPPNYDSLVAKLIVHGENREEAIARMRRALAETVIEGPGVKTTVPFHLKVMDNTIYKQGTVYTNFVATQMTN